MAFDIDDVHVFLLDFVMFFVFVPKIFHQGNLMVLHSVFEKEVEQEEHDEDKEEQDHVQKQEETFAGVA